MSRPTFSHAYIPYGRAEASTSIDELIRPGLRRAYPLPREDHGNDARFGDLLEALAQRSGSARQVATHTDALA